MESNDQIVARARKRLIGAKSRQKASWQELFAAGDKDRNKSLDVKEVKHVIREKLHIPETSMADYEIHAIFDGVDLDGSGAIDLDEFLKYVSRGPIRPEDEEKLFAKRTQRVHRNLRMGFSRFRSNELAVSKLFEHIDLEGDGRISLHELNLFMRRDLKLSQWDVFDSDLKVFYKSLDENGDGVDVNELLQFIQKTKKSNSAVGNGKFSFVEDRCSKVARKKPTYKSQLLSQMQKSQSAGNLQSRDSTQLSKSRSASSLVSTPSFVNLGRTRPAIVR